MTADLRIRYAGMHALRLKNARREFLRAHRSRVGAVRAATPEGTRAKRLSLRQGTSSCRDGRFLNVDPLIQNSANSQNLNPYSYIGNNPLSGTDPTGYYSCTGSHINRDDDGSCADQGVQGGSTTQSNRDQREAFGKWASAQVRGTATMGEAHYSGNVPLGEKGPGGQNAPSASTTDAGNPNSSNNGVQSSSTAGAAPFRFTNTSLRERRSDSSSDIYDESAEAAIEPLRQRALDITYKNPSADGVVDLQKTEFKQVFDYEIARIGMRSKLLGGYENLSSIEFEKETINHGDSLFYGDNGGRLYRIDGHGPYVGGDLNYVNQGLIFAAANRGLWQAEYSVVMWHLTGNGSISHLNNRLDFTRLGYYFWKQEK